MKQIISLSLCLLLVTGCVPLLIGAGAGIAGYSLSNDAATGNVKTEYRVLWDMCLDKLDVMEAEILSADESKGMIKVKMAEHNVSVKINSVNVNTQRLKVSARQLLMPKAQFAQKVFLKLVADLQ